MAMQELDYYRQHNQITDPGKQVACYGDLPRDIAGLVRIVQGLLIPPYSALLRNHYHVDPEEIDNEPFGPFGPRRIEDLIERIQIRHAASLTVERPPALRIGVICRNYAVLLVSMLRHLGIPARARVGFGGYFAAPYAADHRVTEYWDAAQDRWVLVDAMIDEVQRRANKLTFNTLDIGPDDPFWLAGVVWQRCRAGELDPLAFGDSIDDLGMPPIRYALLHDFAYLNKCEVPGCDAWGDLITKPEADLTADDLALLDRIADLTVNVDQQFATLRTLFEQTDYGQAVRRELAAVL
ncbi:MAG TPA: transglutaminase-like domain-containing protein [Ktedonosporobacter sp.]|nr:transglutaminase-like domain-containing protein [Ktedonosporobacter sp.]